MLYGAGRLWGRRLFDYRWVQRVINLERRKRFEERMGRHGIRLLLLARLLPPLRTGVFVTAGAIHFPFSKFLAADVGYAVVGVGVFFFGGTWVIESLRHLGHWAAYLGGAALLAYALYRYYRYLRSREVREVVQAPISVLELPEGGVKA